MLQGTKSQRSMDSESHPLRDALGQGQLVLKGMLEEVVMLKGNPQVKKKVKFSMIWQQLKLL